jgi:hypothetical protein
LTGSVLIGLPAQAQQTVVHGNQPVVQRAAAPNNNRPAPAQNQNNPRPPPAPVARPGGQPNVRPPVVQPNVRPNVRNDYPYNYGTGYRPGYPRGSRVVISPGVFIVIGSAMPYGSYPIDDWAYYNLPQPCCGEYWVQYGPSFLLISPDGVVLQAITP